jgi:Tfp pilus assembly protein PilN
MYMYLSYSASASILVLQTSYISIDQKVMFISQFQSLIIFVDIHNGIYRAVLKNSGWWNILFQTILNREQQSDVCMIFIGVIPIGLHEHETLRKFWSISS